MQLNTKIHSIFRRYPIITWIGALFCFVLFPIIAINYGTTDILSLHNNSKKSEIFAQMDAALDLIISNSNDTKYFHKILLNEFNKAKKHHRPIESISNSIMKLKQKYPNCFKFIVWDIKGEPIKQLTDEKRFRYIVKNLYKLFNSVFKTVKKNGSKRIEDIGIVKKKINIFKNYLGRFLIPAHLKYPILSSIKGECVLADTKRGYPFFWYNCCQSFSMFCAINNNAIGKYYGSIDTVQELNSKTENFSCGVIDLKNGVTTYPKFKDTVYNEFILEFSKFENSALPHIESESFLMNFRLISPNLRGFCIAKKENHLINIKDLKNIFIGYSFKILVPFLLILYCYKLRKKHSLISIKLTLAGLLIYANLLPLSILSVISAKYLVQSRAKILKQFHRTNVLMLNEIDLGFNTYLEKRSVDITKNLKPYFDKFAENSVQTRSFLKEMLENSGANELMIIDSKSNIINIAKDNNKIQANSFIKSVAESILMHANIKETDLFYKIQEKIQSKAIFSIKYTGFTERMFRKLGKIQNTFFGQDRHIFLTQLIKNNHSNEFSNLIFMIYDPEKIQRQYFHRKLKSFKLRHSDTYFVAQSSEDGDLISNKLFGSNEHLTKLFKKTTSLRIIKKDSFPINSKNYVVTSTTGRNMSTCVFAILSPLSVVFSKLQIAKLYTFLFLLFNLAISITISLLTLKQFILPIKALERAVSAIGNKNFRYRTQISTNDEFSQLGLALNSTIEEMSELEIGATVQKNLLPLKQAKNGKISIFAKSIPMSKMGGDYYDYFFLDDNSTGLFMGDVSGHGIPAAIIAAMIKASLLMQKEEKRDPKSLLGKLNHLLCTVKSKKFRRLMSCQYLILNTLQNKAIISNAGHCFPIRVSCQGEEANFMEYIGNPIGISPAIKYQNSEFPIKPGETYILYSDGIMEGINKNNEMFGDARFLQLSKDSWRDDMDEYCSNMINAYNEWAVEVDDDITLVIVRYEK